MSPQHPIMGGWPKVILNVLVEGKGTLAAPNTGSPFQLFEDNTPQQVQELAGPGSPVSLCIQIDISASMATHIDAIRDAAISLVGHLPVGSEVMVVYFEEKSFLVQPFTSASAVNLHLFEDLRFGHRTAMYDSMIVTENYFVHFAHYPRRALVLIGDGHDNASSLGYADALRTMQMPGVPFVYALRLINPRITADAHGPNVYQRPTELATLLSSARAHIVVVPDDKESIEQADEIANCIEHQYALTYTSTLNTRDKRLHKIEIKMPQADKRVKVDTLEGYYIPGS